MGHSKKQDEKYDAKMAYNKNLSAKARMHYLENNIADHKGPSKMDPMYNGKPGVQKEDFQQFAGPSKHGEMHDSPMSMGGSFMSKHASNSYFHKKNLLDDMPIDDHAGGPLKQTAYYSDRFNKKGQSQADVMNLRQNQINAAKSKQEAAKAIYDTGDMTLNDYNATIDAQNQAVNTFNQSLDSIGKVNTRIAKVLKGHEFKLKGEK